MSRLSEEVFAELKGELEAIGLPEPVAEQRARRQLSGVEAEGGEASSRSPAQHVIPVSRGWLVTRRFAVTDTELFPDRESAVARARELAGPVGAAVLVLGTDGRVEERLAR